MKKQPRWKRILEPVIEPIKTVIAPIVTVVTAVATVLVLTTSTQAADKYVEQTGGASCTSGSGSPMSIANYNAGSCSATGGDTVHFTGTFTTSVTLQSGGSSGNHVIYDFSAATMNVTGSYQLLANGQDFVTVLGGTANIGNGYVIYSGFNFVTDWNISGWTVTGASGTAASSVAFQFLEGIDNVVFENNSLDEVTRAWHSVRCSNNVTIRNNYIRGNITDDAASDLVSPNDCRNCTIEGNTIILRAAGDTEADHHNDIIQLYPTTGGTCNQSIDHIVIRYNWLKMSAEDSGRPGDDQHNMVILEGFTASTDGLKMYGNVLVGDNGGGVQGIDVNANAGANTRIYIYNNTVIGRPSPTLVIRADNTNIDLYMRNNIFYHTVNSAGPDFNPSPEEAEDWNYNFFYQYPDADSSLAGANGSLSTDPEFEDVGALEFWLATGSPLIGAGISLDSEYNQGPIAGATWPNPTLATRNDWDVGAYVMDAESPPAAPTVGRVMVRP